MKVDVIIKILSTIYVSLTFYTVYQMNSNVPLPYMDEVFHYAMTDRYFHGILCCLVIWNQGNYSYWDPKITTFPGLYVVGNM